MILDSGGLASSWKRKSCAGITEQLLNTFNFWDQKILKRIIIGNRFINLQLLRIQETLL